MSPDQLGEKRPALNGLMKNLYFTGHWTQPGGGITPVIVSAMQVAHRITRAEDAAPADLHVARNSIEGRDDFTWAAYARRARGLSVQGWQQ
jgi:hypothetical protein